MYLPTRPMRTGRVGGLDAVDERLPLGEVGLVLVEVRARWHT